MKQNNSLSFGVVIMYIGIIVSIIFLFLGQIELYNDVHPSLPSIKDLKIENRLSNLEKNKADRICHNEITTSKINSTNFKCEFYFVEYNTSELIGNCKIKIPENTVCTSDFETCLKTTAKQVCEVR